MDYQGASIVLAEVQNPQDELIVAGVELARAGGQGPCVAPSLYFFVWLEPLVCNLNSEAVGMVWCLLTVISTS